MPTSTRYHAQFFNVRYSPGLSWFTVQHALQKSKKVIITATCALDEQDKAGRDKLNIGYICLRHSTRTCGQESILMPCSNYSEEALE